MQSKWVRWVSFSLGILILLGGNSATAQNQGSAVKEAYVFSASHLDPTFTGPPPFSYERFHRIFDAALKLADEQPDFRFVIENMYAFDQYLRTHPEKQALFTGPIQKGQVELAGQVSIVLQNVVTGEDLARNILLAREFAQQRFGVLPRMQSLSDDPGQTPQVPQLLTRAGLKGLIISRAGPKDAHLFDWKGLDGSSTHAASLSLGYAGGYLTGITESLEAMEGTKLAEFQLSDISAEIMGNKIKQPFGLEPMAKFGHPGGLDRILLETAWDNAIPQAEVANNIAAWNQKHGASLRLIPMLPGEFFESHWPEKAPVKTGEIPSVWGNGYWSLLGGYPQHIRTTHKLLRAEKWASLAEILAGFNYPAGGLRHGWWEHLLTLDHESAELVPQRDLAEALANRTLQDAQQAIASHVQIPQKMDVALVVFNALNWKRSETVTTQVYFVGDPFTFFTRPYHKLQMVGPDGKPVPFEIVSTASTIVRSAWIRFRADDVPGLGWKTYYLRPAETNEGKTYPKPTEATGEALIENASVRAQSHPQTASFTVTDKASGIATALRYYHQPQVISPEPGFFRMKDEGSPVNVTWQRIARGENLAGPYLEAEGTVEGVGLKVQLQLDGARPVAIAETVRGGGGKAIKLVREVEFPEGGKFVYGVPFGTQRLDNLMEQAGPEEKTEMDQISRTTWLTSREFDGWAAWRAPGRQVTVASEARGGTFEGRKLKTSLFSSDGKPLLPDYMLHAVPNELLTGFQIGFAPDTQAAPQLGWELYNPLETMVSVGYMSGILPAEFAGAEGGSGVIVSALKKAEDGKGWIARAYASEKPGVWPKLLADRKFSVREVNMVESEQTPPSTKEGIQPFEIRTVRLVEK